MSENTNANTSTDDAAVQATVAGPVAPAATAEAVENAQKLMAGLAAAEGAAKNPPRGQRNVRFQTLLPATALTRLTVLVIGVGAVGLRIAQMMAGIGPKRLILVDPDAISKENLGNQGFPPAMLGKSKVSWVASMCSLLNPSVEVLASATSWSLTELKAFAGSAVPKCVFAAVDNMNVRKAIAMDLFDHATVFSDCRMFGNFGQVFTKTPSTSQLDYLSTLVEQDQVYAGGASCGGPVSAPWTSGLIASLAVSQAARVLHNPENLPITPYVGVDLRLPTMYSMPCSAVEPGEVVGSIDSLAVREAMTPINTETTAVSADDDQSA